MTAKLKLSEPLFDPLSQSLFYRKIKSLHLDSQLDIEDANITMLGRLLKAETGTKGSLSGQQVFSLDYDLEKESLNWSIKGSARSNDASLYGFKLLNTETDFTITDTSIQFDNVHVYDRKAKLAIGDGSINFKGLITINSISYPFNLD